MSGSVTTCDVCGRTWDTGDDPVGWLSVEVTTSDGRDEAASVYADFCSQEHAAAWLAAPLPTPTPWTREEQTWRDRVAAGVFALVVLGVLGLLGLGLVTAVRLLLSTL